MTDQEAGQPPERPDLEVPSGRPPSIGTPATPWVAAPRRSPWGGRIAVLLAVLLVTAVAGAAGGYVGARVARQSWETRYRQAVTDTDQWKAQASRWRRSSQGFQERSDTYQQQSRAYQTKLENLEDAVDSAVGDLDHPNFSLWNACDPDASGCELLPGHEYVGGVPDTFTYHVSFRATVPVTVWILDVNDFVCWETRTCEWHAAAGWEDRTSLDNAVFHDAEGCAGYMAVFVSDEAGTLYPDVRVTRNPAPQSTGSCSDTP